MDFKCSLLRGNRVQNYMSKYRKSMNLARIKAMCLMICTLCKVTL